MNHSTQASLSITNSRSLLKLMSIESEMPSSHPILCRSLFLLPPIPPSIRVFSKGQLFAWGGQSIGVSASASVLPMNAQDWSPLGWTGWLSLQSKGLSRVFSNTTVQKHQFFGAQLSSRSSFKSLNTSKFLSFIRIGKIPLGWIQGSWIIFLFILTGMCNDPYAPLLPVLPDAGLIILPP